MTMDLPEEIVYHIQSFLDIKQAAQTCLLSKSWYQAWSTRPILAFDVEREKDNAAILESIRTRVKRYKESNINLQKLEFYVRGHSWHIDKYDILIDELIREHASGLGVNELHLTCIDTHTNHIVIHVPARVFAIPSLTKLSIRACRIMELPRIDTTSRLVSLRLDRVYVGENDSIIQGILLQCPLIENLELKHIRKKISINLGGLHNLVSVRVLSVCHLAEVAFESTTNDVPEFHKLRIVSLESVKIVGGFFTNFSSRFPCIEVLYMNWCKGYETYDHPVRCIQISSKSLKYINLVTGPAPLVKAEFDVPNIRKFGFESDRIPTLSFSTVSREWESRVEFIDIAVEASVFERLRKLRKELSQSRIYLHLSLDICSSKFSSTYILGDPPSSATVSLVENLTVEFFGPQEHSFLAALVRYCRPTSITLISTYSCMSLSETIDLVQHAQDLFAYQKNATECSSIMIKYDIKKFEYTTGVGEWQAIEMRNFVNGPNLGLTRDLIKVECFRIVYGVPQM